MVWGLLPITEALRRTGRTLQPRHTASAAKAAGSEAGDPDGTGSAHGSHHHTLEPQRLHGRSRMLGSRPGAVMRMEWDTSQARSAVDTS